MVMYEPTVDPEAVSWALNLITETSQPGGSESFDEMMAQARLDDDEYPDLPEVAPGVLADVNDRGQILFINVVYSVEEDKGNVGRWLDSLSNRNVIVPAVVSRRFAGMLKRRGYRHEPMADQWRRGAS
jgi:hypothetical protein